MVILKAFLSAFLSGFIQGLGIFLALALLARWWTAP
jgi:hypothetical protein